MVRRCALNTIGQIPEGSVAEDVLCSTLLLGQGWRTAYIHEGLQYGQVPGDYGSHIKQRTRWVTILRSCRPLSTLLTLMADGWYNASCRTASFLALGLGDTRVDICPTYIWPPVRHLHSLQHLPYYIYVLIARSLDIWVKDGGICNQRSTKVADSRMLARICTEPDLRIFSFLTRRVQEWTKGNQSDSVDGTMYVIIT